MRAACLTPPAAGGVAVIQVVGAQALERLAAFLRSRRPIDPASWSEDELRLCRVMDGQELIDDAIVCVKGLRGEMQVVDISLHGGPRVVQRVLRLLQSAGTAIVEARQLGDRAVRVGTILESEAVDLLLQAQTRQVALWLAGMPRLLTAFVERTAGLIADGNITTARLELAECIERGTMCKYLLAGARCVLIGEPNAGKSTLANALARREAAIVSDVPGTTRDWVEHPGAIGGIPFTFVDTAGIRESADPLEQEAIRRTYTQIASADVVVLVLDSGRQVSPTERRLLEEVPQGPHRLVAWNKIDLPRHEDHGPLMDRAGERGYPISGQTGQGLDELRQGLCRILGLERWDRRQPVPILPRQTAVLNAALTELNHHPAEAVARLRSLVDDELRPEGSGRGGYNQSALRCPSREQAHGRTDG